MSIESGSEERYFITRHAKPARDAKPEDPKSAEYPDLTEFGVAQARDRAEKEVIDLVDSAPDGSIIFVGAVSDQPRTKQTAELYGRALMLHPFGRENLLVLTKKDIEQKAKGEGTFQIAKVVKQLQSEINEGIRRKTKVLIDYPLTLKELSYKYHDRWTDKEGNKTEYFTEILKKHNNNHAEAGQDWIASGGRLELADGRVIQGPAPAQVAAEYLEGLRRVKDFVQKYVPDRPVVIGAVGHQWDLDALVTFMANNGMVDQESFERITGGEIAGETEFAEFVLDNNGVKVKYRGKEFSSPS